MKKILISNDDGINASGIIRLAKAARKYGEVWVVAPDFQRSGASHSINLHNSIDVYESDTWSIRCIDTKGFEYNIFEQWKTIRQVKKYTKSQLVNKEETQNNEIGVDAVWYCVEGTARRTFTHNITLMNKAIKESSGRCQTRTNKKRLKKSFTDFLFVIVIYYHDYY